MMIIDRSILIELNEKYGDVNVDNEELWSRIKLFCDITDNHIWELSFLKTFSTQCYLELNDENTVCYMKTIKNEHVFTGVPIDNLSIKKHSEYTICVIETRKNSYGKDIGILVFNDIIENKDYIKFTFIKEV